GISVQAAAGIARAIVLLPRAARASCAAICSILLGTLAVLSWQQSHMYADGITLYKTTLDRNPDCWMAHNNLGVALVKTANRHDAFAHYRMALRLRPNYFEAHANLAMLLAASGQLPEAMEHRREA